MRCPICHTDIDPRALPETRPFCSPRCKRIDLGNWLEGKYVLPRELLPEDLEALSPEEQEQLMGQLLKRQN